MLAQVKSIRREEGIFNHLVVETYKHGKASEERKGIRMTDPEMTKLLCRLGLKYKKELVGKMMYLTQRNRVCALIQLKGEVAGNTSANIDGIVIRLSGQDGKCIWKIGDGEATVTVATDHENVRNIANALSCTFPWELQGKEAIYKDHKAYILCKID